MENKKRSQRIVVPETSEETRSALSALYVCAECRFTSLGEHLKVNAFAAIRLSLVSGDIEFKCPRCDKGFLERINSPSDTIPS